MQRESAPGKPHSQCVGCPPDYLRIEECDGEAWDKAECPGAARRVWIFADGELKFQRLAPPEQPDAAQRRGMFYKVGHVQFHIASDRKRLVLTYCVGPRYARGMVLQVVGQGARASTRSKQHQLDIVTSHRPVLAPRQLRLPCQFRRPLGGKHSGATEMAGSARQVFGFSKAAEARHERPVSDQAAHGQPASVVPCCI
jgi:hypothetical protein